MRVFTYLLFVVFILTASDSEAAVINNLRAGTYADKTRIVLDLDDAPNYSEVLAGSQLNINIDADVRQENVLTPKSDLVKKVILRKAGQGKAKVLVDLSKEPGSYKVFILKSPNRLVIDFYKYV